MRIPFFPSIPFLFLFRFVSASFLFRFVSKTQLNGKSKSVASIGLFSSVQPHRVFCLMVVWPKSLWSGASGMEIGS
jgi:hypothetical protein